MIFLFFAKGVKGSLPFDQVKTLMGLILEQNVTDMS